ncbi:hypothetical protein H0H87_007555 [Tephrocybe sp. NHM501043]|nr:hypothetical protein H0H87_007555 [Tephrocybe sp. NHM501043]
MSGNSAAVPLRNAVLGSLFLAWAWGVIAGSVGLNALIKSNQQKSRFKKLVPPPTQLSINTNGQCFYQLRRIRPLTSDDEDVFKSGIVLTVVGALIAVFCSIFLLMLFTTPRLTIRSLRLQSLILAFCATWLFATLIPFTDFFANRSAQITATVGGVKLPDSVVKATERALGTTSVYKEIGYCTYSSVSGFLLGSLLTNYFIPPFLLTSSLLSEIGGHPPVDYSSVYDHRIWSFVRCRFTR